MNLFRNRPVRVPIVAIAFTAWLVLSNHCVLGALIGAPTKKNLGAAMHCHRNQPAPAKNGDEQIPCCKVLKAVVISKMSLGPNAIDFVFKEYLPGEPGLSVWQAHTHTLELDTGPPRALSFTESVLQRSILAHAPPLSLS